MNPTAAAVAALLAAHTDPTADTLVRVLGRFNDELVYAYVIAADAEPGARLDALVDVARRLATEPGSPTRPGWEAFLGAVAGARAGLPDGASGLVGEIEAYLHGEE